MSKKHKKNKGFNDRVPANGEDTVAEVGVEETEESPVDELEKDFQDDVLPVDEVSAEENTAEEANSDERSENFVSEEPQQDTLDISALKASDEAETASDEDGAKSAEEEDNSYSPQIEEAEPSTDQEEEGSSEGNEVDEPELPESESGSPDPAENASDSQEPIEGQGNDEDKIKAEADEAAEKARIKAEKKARNREKRKENNKKFREWVKRHKVFVSIFVIVFALIVGVGVTTLVLTRNMYFVYKSSDIDKMISKNERTDLKLEKDVTYDGDLTLNGYTVDLNKHTLTINGNLTLNNDEDSVIAKRSVFKKDYEIGGNLIVNGVLTLNGVSYKLYSPVNVETLKVDKGDVEIIGTVSGLNGETAVKYDSSSDNKTLTVCGTVNGSAELGDTSVLIVNGSIKNVTGGDKIRVNDNASIGYVKGCDKLYLEPQSKWEGFDSASVNNYYFVQTLAMPVLLITEKDGAFTCTISHVDNADAYEVVYADQEAVRVNKNSGGNNTVYVLPHQDPGKYTLKVTAVSDNAEQFKSSAAATTSVDVYITLSTPVVEGFKESVENGEKKVVLRFGKVDHALKYEINVEGNNVTVDATESDVVEVDVSDYVKKVGSYTVYVKATAPDTNYKTSDNAMVSYVHVEKLALGAIAENTDDGFAVSWDSLEGAYAYEVKLYSADKEVADVVLNSSVTSLVIEDANGVINSIFGVSEADAYSVAPKGKGFYKDGDAKKNSYVSVSKIIKKANSVKTAIVNWYALGESKSDMWYNSTESIKDSTLGGYIATAVQEVEVESEVMTSPTKPQDNSFYVGCSNSAELTDDAEYNVFVYNRDRLVKIIVKVVDGELSSAEVSSPEKY